MPYNSVHVFLLQEIRGLQNCPELKKLYLYDNQISEIKNLDAQMGVEILWLNNNRISHIQVCSVGPVGGSHPAGSHNPNRSICLYTDNDLKRSRVITKMFLQSSPKPLIV